MGLIEKVRTCAKDAISEGIIAGATAGITTGVAAGLGDYFICLVAPQVHRTVDLEIDAETCKTIGGEPTRDGHCRIHEN